MSFGSKLFFFYLFLATVWHIQAANVTLTYISSNKTLILAYPETGSLAVENSADNNGWYLQIDDGNYFEISPSSDTFPVGFPSIELTCSKQSPSDPCNNPDQQDMRIVIGYDSGQGAWLSLYVLGNSNTAGTLTFPQGNQGAQVNYPQDSVSLYYIRVASDVSFQDQDVTMTGTSMDIETTGTITIKKFQTSGYILLKSPSTITLLGTLSIGQNLLRLEAPNVVCQGSQPTDCELGDLHVFATSMTTHSVWQFQAIGGSIILNTTVSGGDDLSFEAVTGLWVNGPITVESGKLRLVNGGITPVNYTHQLYVNYPISAEKLELEVYMVTLKALLTWTGSGQDVFTCRIGNSGNGNLLQIYPIAGQQYWDISYNCLIGGGANFYIANGTYDQFLSFPAQQIHLGIRGEGDSPIVPTEPTLVTIPGIGNANYAATINFNVFRGLNSSDTLVIANSTDGADLNFLTWSASVAQAGAAMGPFYIVKGYFLSSFSGGTQNISGLGNVGPIYNYTNSDQDIVLIAEPTSSTTSSVRSY
jgi:hypothetical protein